METRILLDEGLEQVEQGLVTTSEARDALNLEELGQEQHVSHCMSIRLEQFLEMAASHGFSLHLIRHVRNRIFCHVR